MKAIAIYVEGGGDTAQQRAELRNGFDALLRAQKQAARAKRLGWKLVPSGGRDHAYHAFRNTIDNAREATLVILLVDSEEAVARESDNEAGDGMARIQHLRNCDGWRFDDAEAPQVHLMVQCMEAWIVADSEAVAAFYGTAFQDTALPKRSNLEDEPKPDVMAKLKKATAKTQKGEYAKIKHASKLLALIAPAKVSAHCARFQTLSTWLTSQIEAAATA